MEYENYSRSENTLLPLLIQINEEEGEVASAQMAPLNFGYRVKQNTRGNKYAQH
jgi:hypothetical protein